jgi:adenosylmethionine-8-amino-7-oxononanoate aminotransferase
VARTNKRRKIKKPSQKSYAKDESCAQYETSHDTGLTKNIYTVQKGKHGDQVHGSSIPQDKSQETKTIPRTRSTEIRIEMTSTGEHKKHNRAKRTISLKSTPKLQSIHGGHHPPSLI